MNFECSLLIESIDGCTVVVEFSITSLYEQRSLYQKTHRRVPITEFNIFKLISLR